MKNRFRLSALLLAVVGVIAPSVQAASTDNITIAAFVPEQANLSAKEGEAVTTMLNRLMTTYGCAGAGFDNRFVVVPNLRDARSEVVGLDSKAVVELDIDLFIGDGLDGTLFSSTSFTVKGVGRNLEQARISALRKAPTRSKEMQDFVNLGKERIVNYYEQQGPAIINAAKSSAQSHDYESAISALFSIPSTCSHYAAAQKLAGEYALKYYNIQNDSAIRAAEQAWTANPTEEGAAAAMEALGGVNDPTPTQKAAMKKLLSNIDAKFSLRETREFQARLAEEKNRHSERMSEISAAESVEKARYDAAASVARAYVASSPKVVYHVHSWY